MFWFWKSYLVLVHTSKLCAFLTFKPFLAGEINAAKQSELNILTDEVDCVQAWLLSLETEKGFLRFSFYKLWNALSNVLQLHANTIRVAQVEAE